MKKIFFIVVGIIISLYPYAQTSEIEKTLEELEATNNDTTIVKEAEDESIVIDELEKEMIGNKEKSNKHTKPNSFVTVEENFDGTDVTIGRKGFFKLDEEEDTIKIKVGKKAIRIVEDHRGADVEFIDEEEFDEEFDIESEPKFKGHWAGFEMGINTLVTNNFSFNYGDDNYMDLTSGRSFNFNINLIEYNINLINNNFGIVTGLGYQLNDYRFEKNNNITLDANNITTELNYDSLGISLHKSKLTTSHLTVPFILEWQIPTKGKDKFFISAGILGGLRIGSHTKVVYKENGNKQKDKQRKDFNIPPFRYAFTARFGYKALKFYATYDFTPLFEKDKGPELYPFSVGFILVSF